MGPSFSGAAAMGRLAPAGSSPGDNDTWQAAVGPQTAPLTLHSAWNVLTAYAKTSYTLFAGEWTAPRRFEAKDGRKDSRQGP